MVLRANIKKCKISPKILKYLLSLSSVFKEKLVFKWSLQGEILAPFVWIRSGDWAIQPRMSNQLQILTSCAHTLKKNSSHFLKKEPAPHLQFINISCWNNAWGSRAHTTLQGWNHSFWILIEENHWGTACMLKPVYPDLPLQGLLLSRSVWGKPFG